ncbi:MAG TPA: 4-hydroxyphenylpyruvate dioxygenase [Pyrinomonadaceae bacterium]|nr:4-hydroxyphenylpyruvate dioxygenase [Pyrinomonadaceae bacterium]
MVVTERELERVKSRCHLKGFDHVELYVGNALQASHFYRTALGFTPVAYAGPETKMRDRSSFVVEQQKIRLVLTSGLGHDDQISEHVRLHGDGVKDIAFAVEGAAGIFEEAIKHGARPVMEPTVLEDQWGSIVKATIGVYGDTVHSFVERNGYGGSFLPGYLPIESPSTTRLTGLDEIDHIAVNVESQTLNYWADYYNCVLDFHQSHQEDILTDESSMNSKVVQNSSGRIKFPILEPASAKQKSQIEEFLSFYHGPGVQHIALSCHDIVSTVRELRSNGIEFLQTPGSYYDALEDRIGKIDERTDDLRELNILVDRDEWGYLMQIFSKPVQSRPTLFFEVIERKEARGFGGGNIKALFQAVEREQALRGNI